VERIILQIHYCKGKKRIFRSIFQTSKFQKVKFKMVYSLDDKLIACMRIAEPIKYYWAKKHELDFNKLLDTSAYKEQHRYEMVKWSMEVRAENKGYFNVEAIRMADGKINFHG